MGEAQFFLHAFFLTTKNIHHRNAYHSRAGEQGGRSLKDGLGPGCLLYRLPASWELGAGTMTPQWLGLSGHTFVTVLFYERSVAWVSDKSVDLSRS